MKTKNLTGARVNGISLRAEMNGNEIVVRAHCATCDNSGVYCYTDIYSLMSDMNNENYFYGQWEFSDTEGSNTVQALCPTCVKENQ